MLFYYRYRPLIELPIVSGHLLAGCSANRGGVSRRSYCKGELLGIRLTLAGCEGNHVVDSIDIHLAGILCSRSGIYR